MRKSFLRNFFEIDNFHREELSQRQLIDGIETSAEELKDTFIEGGAETKEIINSAEGQFPSEINMMIAVAYSFGSLGAANAVKSALMKMAEDIEKDVRALKKNSKIEEDSITDEEESVISERVAFLEGQLCTIGILVKLFDLAMDELTPSLVNEEIQKMRRNAGSDALKDLLKGTGISFN